MHMSDIMSPGNAASFEIAHITELLAERADRLAPLLPVAVKRRVLLHRHLGFATHVAVNDRVASLLSRIPGLELTKGPAHPGHMCSALGAVPVHSQGTRRDLGRRRSRAPIRSARFSTPAIARLRPWTARTASACRNWVQLVAEAMGIEASDAYVGWRNGGAPDIAAIERADPSRYHALIEPEIRKPPSL